MRVRRRLTAALVLALVGVPIAARAEARARVVVRVARSVPAGEGARVLSAMRAQLRDVAVVVSGPETEGATCIADVERESGALVVRLSDASGRRLGSPRRVSRDGEVGASEAASVVLAAVVAANEHASGRDAEPSPATARAAEPPPATARAAEPPPATARASDATAAEAPAAAAEGPRGADAAPPAERAVDARRREDSGLAPEGAPREGAAGASTPGAPWRARVCLFYTGATYAAALPWQSGARVEGVLALTRLVYIGGGYAFYPGADVEGDAASVRVLRHAASAFAGIESRGAVAVGADLGAGLDVTSRSTSRAAAGLAGTADSSYVDPVLAARVHLRWRPGPRGVGIGIAPAVEVAPRPRTLVVEDVAKTAVLTPAAVRFRLDVGGSFDGF